MLTQERLRELFTYCEKTGRLVRKVSVGKYRRGDITGHQNNYSGHRAVKVGNKNYSERRCIWIYHYGEENVPKQIGVKNRVVDDSRIENLYAKTLHTREFDGI